MTVGRHRKIELFAIDRTQLGQFPNEINHAAAQEWLTPGKADFLDPERRQYSRHAQIVGKRQVAVQRAFVARTTVDTLVVTAIRNRDPQVGDGAAEFVGEGQLLAPSFNPSLAMKKNAGRTYPAGASLMASHEAREAQAFPPAPLGKSACNLCRELFTLAVASRVCPKAAAVGNLSLIIDADGQSKAQLRFGRLRHRFVNRRLGSLRH